MWVLRSTDNDKEMPLQQLRMPLHVRNAPSMVKQNSRGDTEYDGVCATSVCLYPRRSCCIPYVKLIVNSTFSCGPVPPPPVDKIENTTCCPPSMGFRSIHNELTTSRRFRSLVRLERLDDVHGDMRSLWNSVKKQNVQL